MSEQRRKWAQQMYQELKHIYPFLAVPDERTWEQKKQDAERDREDLFGPEDRKEEPCRSRD